MTTTYHIHLKEHYMETVVIQQSCNEYYYMYSNENVYVQGILWSILVLFLVVSNLDGQTRHNITMKALKCKMLATEISAMHTHWKAVL